MPLIDIILEVHDAVTPAGRPTAEPMPVAPLVLCVIAVSGELIHNDGFEEAKLTVFIAVTETVLFTEVLHPLLSVTVTLYMPAVLTFILFVLLANGSFHR